LPGQTSNITFKFKKTLSVNSSFTYKFSTNSSCSQPDSSQIKITVNYISSTGTIPCVLPEPSNLIASNVGSKSFQCSWNKRTSITSGYTPYILQYKKLTDSNWIFYQGVISYSSTTCSCLIENLSAGTQYQWKVIDYCSLAQGSGGVVSNIITTTTTSPPICSTNIPTDLNAIGQLGSSNYKITFTTVPNVTQYTMEYYDLSVGTNYSGGIQVINYIDIYNVILTAIPLNHTFKFRIKANNNCDNGVFSEWKTIVPSDSSHCNLNNYPLNLILTSGCSYPGSICGTGNFQWSSVVGAVLYEVQYTILNYTSSTPQPINGTFQTTNSICSWYNMYADSSLAPWRINFRVRSKCADSSWSDFSSWSANFAW
jgi:hypothetical protein